MATKEKIIEDLNFVSDRISSQVRSIALGVIAIVWALLVGEKPGNLTFEPQARAQLLIAALLAMTTMFCDYLQYFFGYLNARQVLRKAEKSSTDVAKYDYTDWRYVLRTWLFWFKQVMVMITIFWLALILVRRVMELILA